MENREFFRRSLRGIAVVLVAAVPAMTGCKNFFIPVCQAYNTCTTTTTTTGTGTGTGTAPTTGTTGTGTAPTTGTTGTTGTGTGTGTTTTSTGGISTTATTGTTTTSNPNSRSLVYVASAEQHSIGAYSVAGGQLRRISVPLVTPNAAPSAIAATPHGTLLYLATASGSIYLYRVSRDGSLHPGGGGASVAQVAQPVRMSLDRSGNWLFVASSSTRQLYQFRVNAANGTLQPASFSTIPLNATSAAQVYLSPDNRNLFVSLGSSGIDAFSFNATSGAVGARLHISTLAAGKSKDNALTADRTSKYLFVGEAGSGIRVLQIVADGVLQEISGSPFSSQNLTPASLVVGPANHHLLVTTGGSSKVLEFSVGDGGILTPTSSPAFDTGASSSSLSRDASGSYLVSVPNSSTPAVQLFNFAAGAPAR